MIKRGDKTLALKVMSNLTERNLINEMEKTMLYETTLDEIIL